MYKVNLFFDKMKLKKKKNTKKNISIKMYSKTKLKFNVAKEIEEILLVKKIPKKIEKITIKFTGFDFPKKLASILSFYIFVQ